jgi:hypothetical protein
MTGDDAFRGPLSDWPGLALWPVAPTAAAADFWPSSVLLRARVAGQGARVGQQPPLHVEPTAAAAMSQHSRLAGTF